MEGKAIQGCPPRKEPFSLKPWIWVTLFSALIIISVVGYYHWKHEIQRTVQNNRLTAHSVARLTLERQKTISSLVQSYCLRPLLIRAVMKGDSEGALQHLLNLKANHPEIDGLFLSDPKGTLWLNFPMDRKSHGKNFSHRDWYQGVSKEWKPYISAAYKRIIDPQDLAIAVCAPIRDERGEVIGILGAVQPVSSFKFVAEAIGMEPDLKVTVIDQKGQVVFSNRFVVEKEIIPFPIPSLVDKARRGDGGDVIFQDPSDDDRKKYAAYAPVKGSGWSAIVEKGQKEILAAETPFFIFLALAGLLSFSTMVLILASLKKGLIIRQMTEERKAAELIQKMNETLEALVEASPLAIFTTNWEGKVELWSPAAERILGWTEKEVFGLPLPFLLQDQPDETHRNLGKIFNGEAISGAEFRCPRKDGSSVDIRVSTSPLRDLQGNKFGNMAIIEDITERKQAEDALRREKERAQKYLDMAAVILVAIDATQEVTLINRRGCEILGCREDEVIGKNWFDHFLPPQDRERVRSVFLRLMAGEMEPIEYFENSILTKNGEERIIAWHNTVLTDEEGKITATLPP
jgi:PAS domain S-box-containing protein